jgi:hypothetical protein
MEGVERRLNMIQSNLQKMGIRAPWSNWPNDNAFRRYIPRILVEKVESDRPLPKGSACWRVLGEPEPVVLSKEEIENSVMPWWDGTIPTICRMTLPALKTILDTPIQTRPLTEFRSWAMKVTEAQYAAAKVIQDWFNARIQRVNFSDPENINRFREELMGEIKVWLERDGLDPRAAASALWRVAHSSRSSDASAASVFMAFPDESLWIIEHKPGVAINCTVTIITGVSYQVPNLISAETDVDVVDVQTHVRGRIVIRKAVVGLIDGQVQPRDPGYPRNMIGLVAANADQPAVGQYYATIKQVSQGAWSCVLA